MRKFCPTCEELLICNDRDPSLGQCNGCGWRGHMGLTRREPSIPALTPKLPYVSIDIETTGLDPVSCQTLELGAVIDDWKSHVRELPQFRRVLVHEAVTGSPYAMALNANLLKLIASPDETLLFCKPADLGIQFSQWLKSNGFDPLSVQAAGKNFASFDMQFLYQLPNFKTHVRFRHRVIDPAILFWEPDDERLPDSKTCYERAGYDSKVAHTAIEDAQAVVWLVRQGIKRLG